MLLNEEKLYNIGFPTYKLLFYDSPVTYHFLTIWVYDY